MSRRFLCNKNGLGGAIFEKDGLFEEDGLKSLHFKKIHKEENEIAVAKGNEIVLTRAPEQVPAPPAPSSGPSTPGNG